MSERVLIAGGGIGGLAAAIGLAEIGIPSIVLEKSARLGEIAFRIQLGPNTFHAFDGLGVGDAAGDMVVYIDNLRLMDAIAVEEITRIPLDDAFCARFKNPCAVAHRRYLQAVFLSACERHDLVELRTRPTVASYRQELSGIIAQLAGGSEVHGFALIAADGLESSMREQLVDDRASTRSGYVTSRSEMPVEDVPEDPRLNAATFWVGPKGHIVHYPLPGWTLFRLAVSCHTDAHEPVGGLPVKPTDVAKGFEHAHHGAREVIEKGQDWKIWVLCEKEPTMDCVDDRSALSGDAAHPMPQHFAQSARAAMEDTVCLAKEFDQMDWLCGSTGRKGAISQETRKG